MGVPLKVQLYGKCGRNLKILHTGESKILATSPDNILGFKMGFAMETHFVTREKKV